MSHHQPLLTPAQPGPSSVRFGALVRDLSLFLAGLAAVAGGIGMALKGTPGLWGALVGAAVTLLFCGTTAAVMAITASKPITTQSVWIVVSWVLKTIVLLAAMALISHADFADRMTTGITILVGVVGSLVLDTRVVLKARDTPAL